MPQENEISITIRRMLPSDAVKVAELEKQCFSQPWSEEAFADAASNENYCYLIAETADALAGYAGCTIACEDADITNIAVAENFRRLGTGAMLLSVLSDQAKERGTTGIFLEVRESNFPARSLYEKNGFTYIGRRKNFYSFPTEDALLMKKEL